MVILYMGILVKIYIRTVLLLGPLNSDPDHRHLGASDAEMGDPHHCDGDSTMYISTYLGVGFPPLGRESAVQVFHISLHLWDYQAIR